MKSLLCTLLLGTAPLTLFANDAYCEEAKDYTFEFTTGYRRDQLDIQVTPPNPSLPVITANEWKNVDIVQGRLMMRAETCFYTYSRAYFNYGRLVEFQHSLTSPTLILNPSGTHHEKGRVYDAEYAFGFSWYVCDSFRITPITGYSYHRIEFESHNRVPLTIAPDSEEAARYNYSAVISKQRTTWRAPFVGVEAEFLLCDCFRVCLNGQYLWAHYNNHGKTREKYNQTYRYKQRSNGYGWIGYGEIGYAFLPCWEAVLAGGYQYWDAKGGRDWTKQTSLPGTEIKSKLHSVNWKSFEVSLGVAYLF